MRLELRIHPITEIRFGDVTGLDGSSLVVDKAALTAHLLEDQRLIDVAVEIAPPGFPCRIGVVFDILEPRAKEPGTGSDFPGLLGRMGVSGQGVTHVLSGSAVTVIDPIITPGMNTKLLEMHGEPASATPYGGLWHLVIVPRAAEDLPDHSVRGALRAASVKAAVYLGQAGIGQPARTTQVFDLGSPWAADRERLPKIAYIGQILAHHRYMESEEPILYGSNTHGMVPVTLHPNEWLDGGVVSSYQNLGVETYFYQNHPVILELLRRHQAGELHFAGTVATVSAALETDRNRNAVLAAHLARNLLHAEGVILTNYGGGAPHADMGETARSCEELGLSTAVLVSEMARDRRAESAMVFNYPEVDAVVCIGGSGTAWNVGPVERVIAASCEAAAVLETMNRIEGTALCGVANQQGASHIRASVR